MVSGFREIHCIANVFKAICHASSDALFGSARVALTIVIIIVYVRTAWEGQLDELP